MSSPQMTRMLGLLLLLDFAIGVSLRWFDTGFQAQTPKVNSGEVASYTSLVPLSPVVRQKLARESRAIRRSSGKAAGKALRRRREAPGSGGGRSTLGPGAHLSLLRCDLAHGALARRAQNVLIDSHLGRQDEQQQCGSISPPRIETLDDRDRDVSKDDAQLVAGNAPAHVPDAFRTRSESRLVQA